MKFKPPKIIRFCYRYVLIGVLIVLPLLMSIDTIISSKNVNGAPFIFCIVCIMLSVIGGVFIHIGFWEKFFAVLVFTEKEIHWKCIFRKTRILPLSNCVEIGAFLENANNGIPSEQIYFSDHRHPQLRIGKNGIMKSSKHLIKFWYSEELCRFLLKNISSEKTNCLSAYRRQRNSR